MNKNPIAVDLKKRVLGLVAVVACVVGIAAPAFAASQDVLIDNKLDGWESPRWNDGAGASSTEVRARWCSRDFQATIRKDRTGLPDPIHGQEWLNCTSYVDSVYSGGATPTGDYHYDINGMDGSCFCDYRTTADTSVYW